MIDPKSLLRARMHLRIAHHIPGRIRLRFALAIWTALPEFTLTEGEGLLTRVHGVQDVRINLAAFSVVVQYDPAALEPGLWNKLIEGNDREAEDVVARLWRTMKPQ